MTNHTPDATLVDYFSWNISAERQRHEWMRLRKSLVSARIRIVVFGHVIFLVVCGILCLLGNQCATFVSLGCFSLFFVSVYLLLVEYLFVQMLPQTPPRFVIRKNGLTEYGTEGPQQHWDWRRANQLSIETDPFNPAYRSLVLTQKSPNSFLKRLNRSHIPLPEIDRADFKVVEALLRALADNEIALVTLDDGAVQLH